MRSQVIDMVGYAGDISTAKDRIGIDSALIMIKGGTSGTAIKVVTCSTSNGDFVDYVTLEAEGASNLVKGYYVNLKGADKYIKVTGAKFADVVFGDCNFDPKGIVATGSVPVVSVLEDNKAVTINASTYTEPVAVNPSSGKDAMKKVTVTLSNIPVAGATLYAFGDAEGVVYLTEIPSEDGEVDVYVPSVTGLASAEGTYAEATGVTVEDTAYARYEDGDIVI